MWKYVRGGNMYVVEIFTWKYYLRLSLSPSILSLLEPLAKRRKMLCYNFVKKEIKSKDSLFVKAQRTVTRRGGKDLLFVPQAKSESHFKSPLVYLARLFNSKS